MIAAALQEKDEVIRQEAVDAFMARLPPKGVLLDIATLPPNKWQDEPEVARVTDGLTLHYFGLHQGRAVPITKHSLRERQGGRELLQQWERQAWR
jgi:hypothetical protein